MLNLNSIMIGSSDGGKLAEFYEKVLQRKPDMSSDGWWGWTVGSAFLAIGDHDHIKGKTKEPARMMFNLESAEFKQEFERVKGLGAKVIAEPYEMGSMWISTFEDLDGNFFQVVSPWEDKK